MNVKLSYPASTPTCALCTYCLSTNSLNFFDPVLFICLLFSFYRLRLKQPKFPVFYLTCTERHTWKYKDVRTQTLMAALAYAKSQDIPVNPCHMIVTH